MRNFNILSLFTPKARSVRPDRTLVRPATQGDAAAIVAIIEPYYTEQGINLKETPQYRELLEIDYFWRSKGGEFVVLEEEGRLIGTLAVRPCPDKVGTVEFDWLYLSKVSVGKGVSEKLYLWAIAWCREHQVANIELWSGEKRLSLHKMYRQMGFKHNGVKRQMRQNPPYYQLFFELELQKNRQLKTDPKNS